MNNINDIYKDELCCGCSACNNVCPTEAIRMEYSGGFLIPIVDDNKCIGCGKCIKVCTCCGGESSAFASEEPLKVFLFNCNNSEVLKSSSSGGFFYWLCQYVIGKGGVVISPGYTDKWNVCHICIENAEDIPLVQGSKYVQSEKKTAYKDINKLLNNGRMVLFGGTPCEIAGLKEYLSSMNANCANLICCEVICRAGVSPIFYEEFVEHIGNKLGNISRINFREKTYGYKTSTLAVYSEKKVYRESYDRGLFLPAFFKGYSIRQCCSSCRYKSVSSNADFTIGDYWGNKENTNGVTLVACNTQKAISIEKLIEEDANSSVTQISLEKGLLGNANGDIKNGRWTNPSKRPLNSKEFDKDMSICSIVELRDKYYPNTFISTAKKILRPLRYRMAMILKR